MEIIRSRKNPLAVHLKKLGASREYRREHGEFLCDGIKLLEEAVSSGADIAAVLTAGYIPFPLPVGTRLYNAPREIIKSLSPLKNAQDTLFSCKIPAKSEFTGRAGIKLLLDGIQDPGNLGTILRTADAFEIESVLLTGNCADPYNPKTVRATMGAVFRPIIYEMDTAQIAALARNGARIIGASPGGGSRIISEVSLKNAYLAIGSEGQGLSHDVLALCAEFVKIPMKKTCESLNAAVAASILMWEAVRDL